MVHWVVYWLTAFVWCGFVSANRLAGVDCRGFEFNLMHQTTVVRFGSIQENEDGMHYIL